MADKFVRVRLPNGDHATVPTSAANANGYQILNQPAVDSSGQPLPPKRNITKKTATRDAAKDEEKKES